MDDGLSFDAGAPTARIATLAAREAERYGAARPRSAAALAEGAKAFVGGLPIPSLAGWPAPFPFVVVEARGTRVTDLDGIELADFWLGDGAALFGHAPQPVIRAIRQQSRHGLAWLMPGEGALEAGRLLGARFGAFRWQVTDGLDAARRAAVQAARTLTGRRRLLVFDGGEAAEERAVTVAFNDLAAVEKALAGGDVAAVLVEPALTGAGIVLPRADFHLGLRNLTRAHGALLIVDEAGTLCAGPGGYAGVNGLEPDLLLLGPSVAAGIPLGVWGLTLALSARGAEVGAAPPATPVQSACLKAVLTEVMRPRAFAAMDMGAARLSRGLARVIRDHGAPWHVARLGARVGVSCVPEPPRTGAEARRARRPALEAALHLALVNRGVLIAPGANAMLVSPATRVEQIDRLILAFDEILTELFA